MFQALGGATILYTHPAKQVRIIADACTLYNWLHRNQGNDVGETYHNLADSSA